MPAPGSTHDRGAWNPRMRTTSSARPSLLGMTVKELTGEERTRHTP